MTLPDPAKRFVQETKPVVEEPRCFTRKCIHFIGVKSEGIEENERVVCKAFPNGIPDDIAYGNNLHLLPVAGDHGLQYKQ